jgi:hypothetical protein
MKLKPSDYKTADYVNKANIELKAEIAKNPALKEWFTSKQISDIEAGKTPTGFQWNYFGEESVLRLVPKQERD